MLLLPLPQVMVDQVHASNALNWRGILLTKQDRGVKGEGEGGLKFKDGGIGVSRILKRKRQSITKLVHFLSLSLLCFLFNPPFPPFPVSSWSHLLCSTYVAGREGEEKGGRNDGWGYEEVAGEVEGKGKRRVTAGNSRTCGQKNLHTQEGEKEQEEAGRRESNRKLAERETITFLSCCCCWWSLKRRLDIHQRSISGEM